MKRSQREKSCKEQDLKIRCFWVKDSELLRKYHDEEWGVPVHDDKKFFEMLILEGAQAGLNWITILGKRENYRKLFKDFDPVKVAEMNDADLELCLQCEGIVRNRSKVFSVRKNAQVFLDIQKEFGSFDKYIWRFVNEEQVIGNITGSNVPTQSSESQTVSKDLKIRGMVFVGPTIMYAFMQAVGLINDHESNCWRYNVCKQKNLSKKKRL